MSPGSLSPMPGAVGSFGGAVAMQPCLFKESLAETSSVPAAGPAAAPAPAQTGGLQPVAGQEWGPPRPCLPGLMGSIVCRETREPGFLR